MFVSCSIPFSYAEAFKGWCPDVSVQGLGPAGLIVQELCCTRGQRSAWGVPEGWGWKLLSLIWDPQLDVG